MIGEVRHPSANWKARTRPSVTVSYAQTLDGRIATATGESQWIGCPDSLRFAHEMRASHDAVVVRAGTVRKDDLHLTVHRVPGTGPLRVVIDTNLVWSPPTSRQPLTSSTMRP